MSESELGPTGKFPQGKLNEQDDGEIRIGIAADIAKRRVVVQFGTMVSWFAMPPELAREIAAKIIEQAQVAEGVPS